MHAEYHSQWGQDKFVNEQFFFNYRNGVFVDIGANDGVSFSNSLFFEEELGWQGICVEPLPHVFEKLKQRRRCICVQGCVADKMKSAKFLQITSGPEMLSGLLFNYHPAHIKRIEEELRRSGGKASIIDVPCFLFNDLMKRYGFKHVNFLSIDTEGNEFEILSTIDYESFQIDVITVEDNYNDIRMPQFLEKKNFYFLKKQGEDLIFVNNKFKEKAP